MHRVRVIHWKPAEAEPVLEMLRTNGFTPEFDPDPNGSAIARALRSNLPDAILIDLSRLPSHGRELAVWLRNRKSTRTIPILFYGGEKDKVAQVKAVIPDAAYTTQSNLTRALKKACSSPQLNPVIPPSMEVRTKNKTTAQKLGIIASSSIAVIDPPRDYLSVMGDLPEAVEVFEDPADVAHVTLWFIRDSEAMQHGLRRMRAIAAKTKLWLVWPKGSSNKFREGPIRETALDNGLVDYKICSLNEQWSGILFARKK